MTPDTSKKQTYMITSNFTAPYAVSTGNPRNPTTMREKRFRKGEIISGSLQKVGNKPNFVLYNDVVVIPLSVVKAVVTKEIVSSAAGSGNANTIPNGMETTKNFVIEKSPKTKYMDAALAGAAIGLVLVYIANKKAWIKVPNNMNYAYGAGIGAFLGAYAIFRSMNKPKTKVI